MTEISDLYYLRKPRVVCRNLEGILCHKVNILIPSSGKVVANIPHAWLVESSHFFLDPRILNCKIPCMSGISIMFIIIAQCTMSFDLIEDVTWSSCISVYH